MRSCKDEQLLSRDVLIEKLKIELVRLKRAALRSLLRTARCADRAARAHARGARGERDAARAPVPRRSCDRTRLERAKPVRKPLPAHLPRETRRASSRVQLPECGGELKALGEDVSEVLEYVPSHFKVIRHVRPKLAVREVPEHHASAGARAARSRAAWPDPACSHTCWCRSTAIICRCIGRARSTRARAWSCSARRSPTGSGSAARCCGRWSTR